MAQLHDVFMKTAFLFASKSKCVSHHVGAIIVKNGRIVATGYNGTPPSLMNCNERFDLYNFDREEHHVWSKDNEVHAEANCIAFAAKNGVNIVDSDIYVTISPCNDCLKMISMTGIKNVYYLYLYDKVVYNPSLLKLINVLEVPNASEIKKWVELNNLYYRSSQCNC